MASHAVARRSNEASLTRTAGLLVRGVHMAAALRARLQAAMALHAALGAPLPRGALRPLSHSLCLLKAGS